MTLVILGIALVACGGATDEPDAIAEPIDADLTPDAEPPPTLRSGTISVQEIRVNGTTDVQGISAVVDFTEVATPALGTGSIGECTTWSFNSGNPPPVTLNEGSVTFALSGTSKVPPCVFLGGAYICPGASGTAGDLVVGPPPVLSDTNATLTAASIGSYVAISGSTSNDGAYAVLDVPSATSMTIAATTPIAETGMNWQIVGGAGPIPFNGDPGLIADADTVDIAFTSGGQAHFASFNATLEFGNDFDLDTPSSVMLSAIPVPATAADMTLACATNNCAPEGLSGRVLLIEATNGDLTGAAATDLPAGTASIVTRCSVLTSTTITVPAAHMQFYSDFFNGAGTGTRIQATFLSSTFSSQGTLQASISVVAGHGIVGFTTP